MALRHEETIPTGILNSAEELRQLIIDNPGLHLLIIRKGLKINLFALRGMKLKEAI